MLIDITRTIGLDTLVYPGDTPPLLERVAGFELGDSWQLSRITCSVHIGTHLDAPAHFIAGGPTLDDLPVSRFMLDVHVIEISGPRDIGPDDLAGLDLQRGEGVLFETPMAAWGARPSAGPSPASAWRRPGC